MTGRRLGSSALPVLVAGLLVVGLAGCGGSTEEVAPANTPATPDTVSLSADVPGPVLIGVVTSLTSAPGEGADWRDPAEGARVAASRFAMGGTDVQLVAVNDKGTAAGLSAAVRTLQQRQVAGIVLASSGTHLEDGLAAASAAGVPVLLPYADDADALPAHSWLTSFDEQTADARIVEALRQRGVKTPFLVDAGGGPVTGLLPSANRGFSPGDDPTALTTALRRRQAKKATSFDGIVVSGPAERQAVVVAALQGAKIDVPVALTPQALSPGFATALSSADGTLSSDFLTAGLDDGDAAALEASARGRALGAYFSALRLTAGDVRTKDLTGERPFTAVAGAADVRSHDAVVALVRAAAAAHSTSPAAVGEALSGLTLDGSAGLAGPALDFATPVAVAADAVVALGSTPQSPGLRPSTAADQPALYWFPVSTP